MNEKTSNWFNNKAIAIIALVSLLAGIFFWEPLLLISAIAFLVCIYRVTRSKAPRWLFWVGLGAAAQSMIVWNASLQGLEIDEKMVIGPIILLVLGVYAAIASWGLKPSGEEISAQV